MVWHAIFPLPQEYVYGSSLYGAHRISMGPHVKNKKQTPSWWLDSYTMLYLIFRHNQLAESFIMVTQGFRCRRAGLPRFRQNHQIPGTQDPYVWQIDANIAGVFVDGQCHHISHTYGSYGWVSSHPKTNRSTMVDPRRLRRLPTFESQQSLGRQLKTMRIWAELFASTNPLNPIFCCLNHVELCQCSIFPCQIPSFC